MNAAMLAPECSESNVRARRFMPAAVVQAHLTSGAPGLDDRMKLYAALANALVWVTECEIGLGQDGPFLELRPLSTVAGRLLAIFTALDRAPEHGLHAQPVAFAALVASVDGDVSLLVDPIEAAVVIPPADVRVLRDVLAEE